MKKNQNLLATISKRKFEQKLEKIKFENLKLIDFIEKYFIEKRGYVFKMPKPGEPVILLYSGGLDSTVAWAYLIEKYKLHVYPLVLRKNNNLGSRHSIKYFKKYFKKRYKEYYHEPLEFKSRFFPPKLVRKMFDAKQMHPEVLLKYLSRDFKSLDFLSGTNAWSPISGIIYQKFLENQFNLKVKAIFLAVLSGDGKFVPSQTLTYLRKTLFFLDEFIPSGELQIASIFFEKYLGLFTEKNEIIKLGVKKLKIPLEKTYSCYRGHLFHCNSCLACYSRRLEFKKAKIVDKTLYYDKLLVLERMSSLIRFLKKYLSKGKKI